MTQPTPSTPSSPRDRLASSTRPARALRLGTRGSALALAQSGRVAAAVSRQLGVEVDLVRIVTPGDRSAEAISQIGGTGIFVSALRDALLTGEIDFAVHSLKDLPTATPDGLGLAAVPPRADPHDVLVCPDGRRLRELRPGTRIGTGSTRRMAQLRAFDRAMGLGLEIVAIRGNVDTRIKKAIDGQVDAVVLAYAGLERLDRLDAVTELIDPEVMLPAPGQGALAIECATDARWGGDELATLLRGAVDDAPTRTAVAAERACLATLEGGCSAPVAALATIAGATDSAGGTEFSGEAYGPVEGSRSARFAIMPPGVVQNQRVIDNGPTPTDGNAIRLRAVVASPDGSAFLRREAFGRLDAPEALGARLAEELLASGARTLMDGR
jgi:hydroxymethylbilane synthase